MKSFWKHLCCNVMINLSSSITCSKVNGMFSGLARSAETTGYLLRLLKISRDHWIPAETTEDQQRPLDTCWDYWRSPETSVDQKWPAKTTDLCLVCLLQFCWLVFTSINFPVKSHLLKSYPITKCTNIGCYQTITDRQRPLRTSLD